MSKSNFHEDVVHQAAAELTDQFPDVVAGARGGERPPFKREVSGQKLHNWWQTVLNKNLNRPENIVGVWQRLDSGTQDELRRFYARQKFQETISRDLPFGQRFRDLDKATQDELRALWGKAQGPTGRDEISLQGD